MLKTLAPTSTKNITVIQTRISTDLKKKAEDVLSKMGLSINDYVRVSLNQVVNNQEITLTIKQEPRLPDDVRANVLESLEEIKRGEFVRFDNTQDMDTFFDNLVK